MAQASAPAAASAPAPPPQATPPPVIDQGDRAYQIAAEIGKGAYGTVYKARDMRNDGQFVALKEIRINTSIEEGMPMSTIREIAMLKQIENFDHPNIVKLFDVCMPAGGPNEMRLWLVFEHIDQDLGHFLENVPPPGLGPDRIRHLIHQILSGVNFLHTNRIVHRDLKPQNILVNSQSQVKLADFGLARVYSNQMALTSVVVTLYYRSPEVLLQDAYCSAVDIWSCGCIFAELHTRRPLFDGMSDIDQLRKIFSIMGLPAEQLWPASISLPWSSFPLMPPKDLSTLVPNMEPHAKDLLQKMLLFDQNERITPLDALNHPYFGDELAAADMSLSFESHNNSSMGSASFDSTETSEDSGEDTPVPQRDT